MPSEYTVSRGDTLSEIAVSNGFKLNDLIGFNNLQNSNIFVGQKLGFQLVITKSLMKFILLKKVIRFLRSHSVLVFLKAD